MIDTIKFKIPITQDIYKKIISKAIEFNSIDNSTEKQKYKFYRIQTDLGSYNRDISFFIDDFYKEFVYVELSLPKFYFGHNVWMIYPSQLEIIFTSLYNKFLEYFGDFTYWHKWEIYRIDLCYAWKFIKDGNAETVLQILRSYNYKNKKKANFDTSLMLHGTTYSLKFYLKYQEYFKHDFKSLKLIDLEFAYEVLDYSRNVLRFEITLRKKALEHYYKKHIYAIEICNNSKALELLNYFYNNLLKSIPTFMTSTEVFEQLKIYYDTKKALHLWEFYKIYHSNDPEDQKILKENYTYQAIWYNLDQLSKAKIGLPKKDIDIDFQLTIPSDYSVNPDPKDQDNK